MSKQPCPLSLCMARLPAKKFRTRDDLLGLLERVRSWMADSPGRYSLDQLAALATLSPFHFHRLFKATYGATPNSYLKECRLAKARKLLLQGDFSVAEVGFEVGFESASSFSREYKKRYGYSPSLECRQTL